MLKAAIIIMADPAQQTEEALGRLFNGLAAAYDFKARGDEVTVLFQGAGTRWTGYLTSPEHPCHVLFNAVADKVAGVSCGCAEVFGATEAAEKNGFDLITDNPIPGTPGLPSLRNLVDQGYAIMTF